MPNFSYHASFLPSFYPLTASHAHQLIYIIGFRFFVMVDNALVILNRNFYSIHDVNNLFLQIEIPRWLPISTIYRKGKEHTTAIKIVTIKNQDEDTTYISINKNQINSSMN